MPEEHAPFLPNAHWLAEKVQASGAGQVKLLPANIEELLEVLLMDGEIERIRIRRPEGDYDTPEMVAHAKKRKKQMDDKVANGRKRKKLKLSEVQAASDSEDLDKDSMDDFIDDDMAEDEEHDFHDDTRGVPNGINGTASTSKVTRPGPPNRDKYYYVYRPIRRPDHIAFNLNIGFVDSPCGVCPVASACDNRERPAFEDRPLSGSGVVYTANPSKLSLEARMEMRLKLKAPGSSIVDDTGPWTGGGTRGKQRVGLVNPKDCIYFAVRSPSKLK